MRAKRDMNCSPRPFSSCASLTRCTIRASVLSSAVAVASATNDPVALRVPARTLLPTLFSIGTDSPVTAASFTADWPSITTPSVAMASPGRTTKRSPTRNSASSISSSRPSTKRLTRFGARSISALIAPRVRSSVNSSSASLIEYRNANAAASSHKPSAPAVNAATVIKSSMSISCSCHSSLSASSAK